MKKSQSGRKGKALLILAIATIAQLMSEALVHTFETVAKSFGWSELFIGLLSLQLLGMQWKHASAIIMAYKNKVNIAVEIAIGSTLQIAMFVAPVLVLLSMFFRAKDAFSIYHTRTCVYDYSRFLNDCDFQ